MNPVILMHRDGKPVELYRLGHWYKNLSESTYVWWITETSREQLQAREEVEYIATQPNHPGYWHACEIVGFLIAQKLKQ